MMVDLYSLPNDFPGYEAGMANPGGTSQADALQQSLAAEIGDPRFIPYLQVHAFESNNLVLVDEGHRGSSGKDTGRRMDARKRLCENVLV
jgi:hypothetical protein